MKKLLLIATLIITCSITVAAQNNGYLSAIGIRGGWGAEVSYQRYIANANRLEGTIGVTRYGFNMSALHQWMFELPISGAGTWQWYAGTGVGMGSWESSKVKDGFCFGVMAQAGIEYTFNIPLMLSIDYRPGFYFTPEDKADWSGIAIGVRYCF